MTRKHILIVQLLLVMLYGALDAIYSARGASQPPVWSIPLELLFIFFTFLWYRIDSDAYGYPRSKWLNVGIILFPPVAVPYYLLRSRPQGKKLRALLKCAGFVVLIWLANAAGFLVSGHTG